MINKTAFDNFYKAREVPVLNDIEKDIVKAKCEIQYHNFQMRIGSISFNQLLKISKPHELEIHRLESKLVRKNSSCFKVRSA